MTILLRLLVAAGLLAQGLMLVVGGYEIQAVLRGDLPLSLENLLLLLSPAILGFGGAAGAAWLRRRGSLLAWPVALAPLAVLLLGLLVALLISLIPFHHQP